MLTALELKSTHPAVADHCPLPRTQLQDVSTKQLLTTYKIHFYCVELFLKGIFIHALEKNNNNNNNKSSPGQNKLIALLAHIFLKECTVNSNRLAQGLFCL